MFPPCLASRERSDQIVPAKTRIPWRNSEDDDECLVCDQGKINVQSRIHAKRLISKLTLLVLIAGSFRCIVEMYFNQVSTRPASFYSNPATKNYRKHQPQHFICNMYLLRIGKMQRAESMYMYLYIPDLYSTYHHHTSLYIPSLEGRNESRWCPIEDGEL